MFSFFDENLLSAWFKDERPQGLSWQRALKGYYTIFWQNYKNLFFGFFFLWKCFFGIIWGYGQAKVNLKNSIKVILYDFEQKMKNFIFQFFDENLLSAWFKDERPQGLSLQSALKGYYTILWQKYKNRVFGFFFLWKWFLVLFKGTGMQKLMWKIPLKGYCMILKKKWKILFFNFLMKICCLHHLRMSALKG